MNGAESLFKTSIAAGLAVCFANPGTTEMPLVRAFDEVAGLRAILCLFEGVCSGAADGYARMAEKPAMTLLHLGPGFANALAYFHDARRARSPIVNVIGDHATWHLAADAPLTTDIESLARPVSGWVRRNKAGKDLANDVAAAVAAAMQPPGQIATLIVPHDCQLATAGEPVKPQPPAKAKLVAAEQIKRAAQMLRAGKHTALLLGSHALRARGLRAAARLAAATGCRLLGEMFPARLERAPNLPNIERVPYFPEQATALLAQFQSFILVGALPPVTFFGYPGVPSHMIPADRATFALASPHDDVAATLEALAEAVNAPQEAPAQVAKARPAKPAGKLTLETLGAAIAALQPENAIIMDEGNTSSGPYVAASQGAPPHSYLTQPGGAIGLGMPCATGAAVACPERKVINIQADGSAMYTLQALWTQAREALDVTTIICNNRSYRILGVELRRAGVQEFGQQAQSMINLTSPALDFVSLAKGLGVPAVRVDTADVLVKELERALAERGPHLIEAML